MNIVHPGKHVWDTLRFPVAASILVAYYLLRGGLPPEREQTIGLLCFALLVATASTDWRRSASTILNWLPFLVLMVIYDYTRGAADDLGMPIQTQLPIVADRLLCDCYVNTVIREWIPTNPKTNSPDAYWYEAVFSVTYASHFLLPYVTSAVFWLKDKNRFYRFRDTFFLLTFAGLLIYILLPTTPPWLAGDQGLIPDISRETRTAGNGWRVLNVSWAEQLLDKGRAASNPVAALPSLHAGYSLFFTLMIWPRAKWTRPILFLFPLVMAVTLMVASEHYFFDIWLGWVFAAGAVWAFSGGRYEQVRAKVRSWLVDWTGLEFNQVDDNIADETVDSLMLDADQEASDRHFETRN